MSKIYKIDTNIDKERIAPFLLKTKEGQPDRTVNEFFRDLVLTAINHVSPQGNTKVLRRTRDIKNEFDMGITADAGIVPLSEEDYRYVKSCFQKADNFFNRPETIESVLMVEDAINAAEHQGTKSKK